MTDLKWLLLAANFALVLITLFYLIETRKLRKLAERSFSFENKPKVYIQSIKASWSIDAQREALKASNLIKVTNVGKTEALDLQIFPKLTSGDLTQQPDPFIIEKLYSGQGIIFEQVFKVNVTNDVYVKIKDAVKSGESITFKKEFLPRIDLEIRLEFKDFDENNYREEFHFAYEVERNEWVIARE